MKTIALNLLCLFCMLSSCTVKNKTNVKSPNVRLHDIWALKSIEGQDELKLTHRPILEIYIKEQRFFTQLSCGSITGNINTAKVGQLFFSHILRNDDCNTGTEAKMFSGLLYQVNNFEIKERQLFFYNKNDGLLMTLFKID